MNKTVAMLAGSVALACGLVWLGRQTSSEPRATAETKPSAAGLEIAEQLQQVRDEVAALRARSQTALVSASPAPLAGGAPAPAAESAEEVVDRAKRREEDIRSAYAARLAGEGRDAMWSDKTEAQIANALSALSAGPKLLSVKCGTSLCRVVVAHNNTNDQRNLSAEIARTPPFADGVFYGYEASANDPPRTTMYVTRPGASPLAIP